LTLYIDLYWNKVRILLGKLKRLKFHHRETYDDVIKRLIEAWRISNLKIKNSLGWLKRYG
jgi:predicted CopG family antitoxin